MKGSVNPLPGLAPARPGLSRGWKLAIGLALGTLLAQWLAASWDQPAVSALWRAFTAWGAFRLGVVSGHSSLLWVLAPAMFVAAMAGALLLAWDKPPDWIRLPVSGMFLLLQVAYLSFRLVATLCLDTPVNATFSILFLLSEVFVHLRIALGNLALLRLTNRSAQADESARVVRSGDYVPTVDVFVPTYFEPVEMLERTIIGCQAMDYPCKTVWLLDDKGEPIAKVHITRGMKQLEIVRSCRTLDAH